MLKSALQIVDMFSGNDSGSDVCHVGSALFMGNNIKLMCSNQMDTLSQTIWCSETSTRNNWVSGRKPKNHIVRRYYRYSDASNCPYEMIRLKDTSREQGKWEETTQIKDPAYNDYITIEANDDYDNIAKVLSGTNISG